MGGSVSRGESIAENYVANLPHAVLHKYHNISVQTLFIYCLAASMALNIPRRIPMTRKAPGGRIITNISL